ncbi:MAG TPA: rod shape-determining protein MreC [Syntrophorhabdaceae bacterium]|nr:rod shape-determining protein MreC [Syntrophorhabdaceae bacterium]
MKTPLIVIIASILILVISFFVFTGTPVFVKNYSGIKAFCGEIAGPALKILGKPVEGMKYIFNAYISLVDAKKENSILKKRIGELELENQKIYDLEEENKRLRSILKITERNTGDYIVARVIGEDVKNWFKCIIIDKGRSDGLLEKMPVITPKGIVGQIIEVNKWHSKVMTIGDVNSSVDVNVEGKETRGILEGTDHNVLRLKYITKNDEIEVGDKLVTSGKDGIYPKGIPAGIVIAVDKKKAGIFYDVEVMPYNNFKRLEEVIVVKRR